MLSRILVCGSEGFVGRHLRRALLARGLDVLGVDLPGSTATLATDLSDPALDAHALARLAGPVDGIIYLAARITRGSSVNADARRNLRAIAEAPVRILEAFSATSPAPHLVYCSSIKVYGEQPPGAVGPAASPLRPDAFSYGAAKALGERLLEVASQRANLSFSVVRPSYVYGPGQPATTAIPKFLAACWQGTAPAVFGNGEQIRDDVFVGDLAYCLAEACQRRAPGTFNATGDRARSLLEVAELCCRAVEALGGPSGLTPVRHPERAPARWINQTYEADRTRESLYYRPRPMLAGLLEEAAWIRDGADPGSMLDYGHRELAVSPESLG
jgi:UDP-glucose 4-epimerase